MKEEFLENERRLKQILGVNDRRGSVPVNSFYTSGMTFVLLKMKKSDINKAALVSA